MSGLRSEHISNRLFFFMSVIILSLLFMAVPLIVSSYQEYLKTKQALVEIKSLRSIAEVANKVSKERAPANKLMSSNAADFLKNQKNLKEYRLSVDRQLSETIHILKEEGYTDLANTLDTKFRDDLKQARAVVDYYVATPEQARSSIQFDNAILAMFGAWDSCREVLQNLMLQLKRALLHKPISKGLFHNIIFK